MGFRLVPKSVTLNDLKLRNGHYFALFRTGTAYQMMSPPLRPCQPSGAI